MTIGKSLFLAAAAACLVVSPALAAPSLFTFGFTDLQGTYDGTSSWSMNAIESTAGDVTRLLPTSITTHFTEGFAVDTLADFSLSMQVTPHNSSIYNGIGSFTITDIDGDTIVGEVAGRWHRLTNNESAFIGTIGNFFLNGETFNGTLGNSFSMDTTGYGMEPFDGAVTILKAGSWFSSGASTDSIALSQGTVVGQVIPAPGAALLGLLGLGLTGARRRRGAASA